MKWSNLTFLSKALITLAAAGAVGAAVYFLSPGLKVDEAKTLEKLDVTDKDVNNITTSAELPLPQAETSSDVSSKPL